MTPAAPEGSPLPPQPPPYYPPYPPPRPAGKPASFYVAILFGVLLAASAFLNLVLFVVAISSVALGGAAGAGPLGLEFEETTLAGSPSAQKKVVVVSLAGLIFDEDLAGGFGSSESPVSAVRRRLAAARKDPDVVGVVLAIDSPGGGVTASDLIHREIVTFRAEKRVPVVAWMKDVAASGGYYAAAATDRIFAMPTTITGSIGVVLQLVNYGELFEKVGLEQLTIVSPETPFKDMGSPTRPMRPEERAKFDAIVRQMYERFLEIVKAGRPGLSMEQVKDLADGSVMTGQEALLAGLVDEIGYLEDAFEHVRAKSLEPSVRLVRWSPHPTFLQTLLGVEAPKPPALALEPWLRHIASGPRFLYLWKE